MPKQNPYFIPKENYKKVEEVRFWDYETKTSKLSPAARSKIIKKYGGDYQSSRMTAEDIALMQMYGPGFWDFAEKFMDGAAEVVKFGGKVVVAGSTAALVVSTAGAAAPVVAPLVGAGLYAGGSAVKKGLKNAPDGLMKDALNYSCDVTKDTGISSITGGLFGVASNSLASQTSSSVFNTGIRTAGTNGSAVLLKTWMYTKAAQIGYDLGSKGKIAAEGFFRYFHGQHKDRGIGYDSECPICNGNFDKYFWL